MSALTDFTNEATNFARDAAYVVVGFGVLGFQKAQVQRNEITKKVTVGLDLEQRLTDVRQVVTTSVHRVDGIVEDAVRFVEISLEPLEAQLPAPVQQIVKKAHSQASEIRSQIRELVGAA